jgi:WD40-like Beta Propeller Repeat
MASGRTRVVVLVLILAACTAGAAAAIVSATGRGDLSGAGTTATRDLLGERRPALLYRSVARDGRVMVAPVRGGLGESVPTALACDRVHFAGERGICLARGAGFASGYRAKVFGADLRVRHEIGVEGVPSRARVSPDGRYGSVTLFVTGHSYADAGQFSTQTTLLDLAAGKPIADLEEFAVTRDGRRLTAVDMNFWGVTFARDSDRFYATVATGGRTYLIEGSVAARSARVLHENVECPSLSPDGTRIAYKRRTASRTRPWHVTVLDLATMRETPLAEPRSVDDQVEWLDDEHVLYGVDGDIFAARADGGGTPSLFVERAGSPAVMRG